MQKAIYAYNERPNWLPTYYKYVIPCKPRLWLSLRASSKFESPLWHRKRDIGTHKYVTPK